MSLRIDSHQHFWDPARGDYGWLDALEGEAAEKLRRPVLPEELAPILRQHRIDRTVLVQAAPSEAEGEFLLSLAERHAFVAGVVVWQDMEATDFEGNLKKLRDRPGFVGIRPMIQDLPDPGWMLRPGVQRAFSVLEATGVCFDFLIRAPQLEATLEVLARFPHLRAVIDHIAKPDIKAAEFHPYAELLARVAEHDNVHCKLSGMITEAALRTWTASDLAPYIRHAYACFGARRLMFGSDWPVCTLAGSYSSVLHALEANLTPLGLDSASMDRIFGGTAAEFYRLGGSTPSEV
jgi:L-fuconolactonase